MSRRVAARCHFGAGRSCAPAARGQTVWDCSRLIAAGSRVQLVRPACVIQQAHGGPCRVSVVAARAPTAPRIACVVLAARAAMEWWWWRLWSTGNRRFCGQCLLSDSLERSHAVCHGEIKPPASVQCLSLTVTEDHCGHHALETCIDS
jgi:hypothetical protein